MAFLQREFLPSNDTYKTRTSSGNTLHFIRGNENVTHSAQGETVLLGENFLFRISEYTQRERKCSFRKLQIFISQTTDYLSFSNSLIIHEEKTKEITTVKEVWICDPNYHKIRRSFALIFSKNYQCFEKLYQTLERVFHQISKHFEVG